MRSIGSAINNNVIAPAGRAAAALRRIGGVVTGVGAGLLQLGGLAVTVFGIKSLQNAAAFEEQLAIINTIAKQTPEVLEATGDALQGIAQQTGIALNDVTQAQYEFLSAGIGLFKDARGNIVRETEGIAQSQEALAAAARLSVGGLSSLEDATRVLGFALNTYNLNAADIPAATARRAGLWLYETKVIRGNEVQVKRLATTMGEAADVITDQFSKAIEIGVVTAEQIAGSFATVAASAQFAGIGIDEVSAAYATQTIRGLSARRTTVGMNRAIIDLLKPGKQLQALMERTGKNYKTIADTKGIHIALQEMRNDANRLGIAYEKLFLRQEGWRFALNITQDDLGDASGNFRLYERTLFEIQEATKRVQDENGKWLTQSESQVERRMNTVTMKVRQLRLAFQILSERIGRPLLKPLRDFLVTLTDITVGLYDWAKANQALVKQVAPIVGLASAFIALSAGTQGLLFVLQPLAPMFGTTATNMRGLATVVGRLTLPLGILVGIIGGFKLAVDNGVRGFEMFRSELIYMQRLAGGVIEVFQTIGAGISEVWDALGRGGNVDAAATRAFDAIGQSIENLGPSLERVVAFLARVFVSIGSLIVEGLSRAIPAIVGWFGDVARAVIPELAYLTGIFIGWAQDVVPQIIENLGNFVRNFVTWVGQVGPPIANALLDLTRAFVDWAASVVPVIIDGLGDLAGEIGRWVASVVPRIAGILAELATAIANWFINEAWPAVSRAVSEFLDNILEALQDSQFVRGLAKTGVTIAAAIIGGLAALVGMIATWVAQNIDTIVGIFLEVGAQIIGGIVDFFVDHGPEIAAAGVQAAASLLGGMAQAIIDDPGVIVRAILALGTAAVILSAAVSVGGLIGRAMWVGKVMSDLALGALATALSGVHGAIGTALSGILKAIGSRIAFLIFAAQYYTTIFTQALVAAINKTAAAGAVRQAAQRLGAKLAIWLTAASAFGQAVQTGLSNILTGLSGRLSPVTRLLGGALGTTMMVGMAAAAFGGVLLVANAINEGLNQQEEQIASSVGDLITAGTAEQLRQAEAALEQGLEDMTFFGIPWTWGDSRQKLEGELKRVRTRLGQFSDTNQVDFKFSVRDDWMDDLPTQTESFISDVERRFNEGLDGIGAGTSPINWRELFKEDLADQTIGDLITKADGLFADLQQTLSDGQTALEDAVSGLPTEFTSDAARIQALQKRRKEALTLLEQAKEANDTSSALKITGVIAELDKEILALQNGATLLADAEAVNAATLQEQVTVFDTVVAAQEAANLGLSTAIASRDALMTQLSTGRSLTDIMNTGVDPTKLPAANPKPVTIPPPKTLTPSQVEATVLPFKVIRKKSIDEVNGIPPRVTQAGSNASKGLATGMNANLISVIGAANQLRTSVVNKFTGFSLYNAGYNVGNTFANGMLASIQAVQNAARRLAGVAAGPLVGDSPPKEGPLRTIDEAGTNIGVTWGQGMALANPFVHQQALGLAGAAAAGLNATTSFFAGTQTIAPIGGSRWSGGSVDREALDRQTELLGEIAGATRIGAAASARGASRDPRAGGPMASRSTLQALKHLSITRTRGG